MKITITGYEDGKKIYAIKAIRGITGYGLKEAKDVIDDADAGIATTIETKPHLTSSEVVYDLDYYGVQYAPVSSKQLRQERLRRLRKRFAPRVPRLFKRLRQSAGFVLPIYVTRKNSEGYSATWSINTLVGIVALGLLQLNVILWSVVGLYEAGRIIVGW